MSTSCSIRKEGAPYLVRVVECLRGEVPMKSELVPRFANGLPIPLVSRRDGASGAVAGPDGLYLRVGGERAPGFVARFTVKAGQAIPFVRSWARP